MKKFFGILAVLSLLALFGTIGSVELETISLMWGAAQAVICLVCFVLFCWLSGCFSFSEEGEKYE